jgi:hypothetical protein
MRHIQGLEKASIIYPHLSTFIHRGQIQAYIYLIFNALTFIKKSQIVDNTLQISKLELSS